MSFQYLTISDRSEGLYKEKGSKFLSFAFPVESEPEAQKKIDGLKNQYHDARHHCFAYIIGKHEKIIRAYDAGEPRHTAGDPILNQIRSCNLKDVLVVVVRYFGGTKLGKSGLINAYKEAARDVLKNSRIIEKMVKKEFEIKFDYEGMNDVMRLVDKNQVELLSQDYHEKRCTIRVRLNESDSQAIRERLGAVPHVCYCRELPG